MNDSPSAYRCFKRALAKGPQNKVAIYKMAHWYKKQDQKDEALLLYNKYIEIYGEDYKGYKERAKIYGVQGLYQKAIEDYSKAVQIRRDPDCFLKRGLMFKHLQQFQKANHDITEAASLFSESPKKARCYYEIALIYKDMSLGNKAIENITQAIALDPQSLYYNERARLYDFLGNYQALEKDLLAALKKSPEIPEIYKELSIHYRAKKQYQKSLDILEKAEQKGFEVEKLKIISLLEGKRYEELEIILQEQKRKNPEDYFPYYIKAWTFHERNQFDLAEKNFSIAEQKGADNVDFYLRRAYFYTYSKQDFDKALLDIEQALKMDAMSFKALEQRAFIYENQKRYEEALEDYDTILKVLSKKGEIYTRQAQIYLQMKQYEKSIELYTLAIEEEPLAEYYMKRSMAYNSWGKVQKALEDFATVRKMAEKKMELKTEK